MFPNPFIAPIFFDSCAFDGGSFVEQNSSIEARAIVEQRGAGIELVHSVLKEIEYPNTPQNLRDESQGFIYTCEVNLNETEIANLAIIEKIIVGNGSLEKMKSDCRHVFEAQKYGGHYFITTDLRLLKKSIPIKNNFALNILKPSEFLAILKIHIDI